MDGNSGRILAKRLAQRNGDAPNPPIRGREEPSDAPPIFRWFDVDRPADADPAAEPEAA